MFVRTVMILGLFAGLLVFSRPAMPQVQSPAQGAPASLKIFVLQGQGAINNVTSHMGTVPVVEVRDDKDRVIEGATVTFELPSAGPGGSFPNQRLKLTGRTDMQGQAAAAGFTPNSETGRFRIKVTAMSQGRTATVDIVQTNSTKQFAAETTHHKGISKKWWILGAVAVGGGTAAAILLTRGGGSSSGPPTVTVTPGPITVGPPR